MKYSLNTSKIETIFEKSSPIFFKKQSRYPLIEILKEKAEHIQETISAYENIISGARSIKKIQSDKEPVKEESYKFIIDFLIAKFPQYSEELIALKECEDIKEIIDSNYIFDFEDFYKSISTNASMNEELEDFLFEDNLTIVEFEIKEYHLFCKMAIFSMRLTERLKDISNELDITTGNNEKLLSEFSEWFLNHKDFTKDEEYIKKEQEIKMLDLKRQKLNDSILEYKYISK